MTETRRKYNLSIWALGAGYFVFYTPYSGLTKALGNGLLPGMSRPLSGFEILPLSVAATVVSIYAFITVKGWWKYARHQRVFGFNLPAPGRQTFVSGLCMGAIIATTTLAFSFGGASILFVLVLLRGGILIIGPVVDAMLGRRVRWFSWAAMWVSLLAVLVAFGDAHHYQLGLFAVLDVVVYLAAYFIRLRIMTRLAKSMDYSMTLRYFVEEQIVATPALLAVLVLLAAAGSGDIVANFRWGLTGIWHTDAVVPAILVGVFYAALMVCTTLIFLDPRENTFCIPMHCGSSMMSGVVASLALAYLYHQSPPSAAQYGSTGFIIVALAFLSPLHHLRGRVKAALAAGRLTRLAGVWAAARRLLDEASYSVMQTALAGYLPRRQSAVLYQGNVKGLLLFVCSGNTCRSPMAEAIGKAEIAARFKISPGTLRPAPLRVLSVGLSAQDGAPMARPAQSALRRLGVPIPAHASRSLTAELVEQATVVYCMTNTHRKVVIDRHPAAAWKTRCLDPEGDIDDPVDAGPEAFLSCATHIQTLVRRQLDDLFGQGELRAEA